MGNILIFLQHFFLKEGSLLGVVLLIPNFGNRILARTGMPLYFFPPIFMMYKGPNSPDRSDDDTMTPGAGAGKEDMNRDRGSQQQNQQPNQGKGNNEGSMNQ